MLKNRRFTEGECKLNETKKYLEKHLRADPAFYCRKEENFEVDNFKNEKSMFFCCFDHLSEGMHFDTKDCLHYYRRVFFSNSS